MPLCSTSATFDAAASGAGSAPTAAAGDSSDGGLSAAGDDDDEMMDDCGADVPLEALMDAFGGEERTLRGVRNECLEYSRGSQ